MNKLYRDELLKAVNAWVLGQLWQSITEPNGAYFGAFLTTGQDGAVRHDVDRIAESALHSANKVWRYLLGEASLDASYSDFECWLGMEAKKIFQVHLPASNYDMVIIAEALGLQTHQARSLVNCSDVKLESPADVGRFIRAQPVRVRL